jgi:F0F1-type ATP synthase membrane subunit a
MSWINDIIRFFFPRWLRNVTWATGELEFNVALAIVATLVILYVQAKQVGWWIKLLHEYVPITGKWLMDNKIGDIVISMFIWLLDIIGIFARIISLSLRLFWNMSAGSILLNVAYLWLWAVTVSLFATNFAIWLPIIVYLQWILSVVIQAFVFSLITWISMKMVSE